MTKTNKIGIYLLLISAVFLFHVIYLNCAAEDAFITFRFAKNLANGHGLLWNIGESPVEGYTNFLWLLLSAFIINEKDDYYSLLNAVTTRNNWKGWINYMLKAVEETSLYTISKIEEIDPLLT